MVIADLLEIMPDGLPPRTAERIVRACLAEVDALQTFGGVLASFEQLEDPEAKRRADAVRDAWRAWGTRTLKILDQLEAAGAKQSFEVKKLRAMAEGAPRFVKDDVAEMKRRADGVAEGEYITSKEARRELGLPRRRGRVGVDSAA